MSVGVLLLRITLVGVIGWKTASAAFPKEFEPVNFECVPYHTVLRDVLVQASITTLSTNKEVFGNNINPSEIEPITIDSLFGSYYKEEVSPLRFESAFYEILYSDPGTMQLSDEEYSSSFEFDKLKLRDLIRHLAATENYLYARKKLGHLIVRSLCDILDDTWHQSRCVARYEMTNAESVIWNEIYKLMSSLSARQFRELFGLDQGSRLSISIDETGTMSREISAAGERSRGLIDSERGSAFQPNYFVLVPFNDPTVGPVTATPVSENFTSAFDDVYAHAGGDDPEMSMRGIASALEKMRSNSQLFVYTDAEAKDVLLQHYVIALAKAKNIRINFIITSRVWSILCFGTTTGQYAEACSDRSIKFGGDLYNLIASETGGRVLPIPRNNLVEGTKIMDSITKDLYAQITKSTITRGALNLEVNVDSSCKKLFVQSGGGCRNLAVTYENKEVKYESQQTISTIQDSVIDVDQKYGKYYITASAISECTVTVSALTTVGVITTFTEEVMDEKNQELFLQKREGSPVSNKPLTVLLDSFGMGPEEKFTQIDVVDTSTRQPVQVINLEDPNNGRYRFEVTPRAGRKLILHAKGIDSNGYDVSRVASQQFSFSDFDFDCSEFEKVVARPGMTARYAVEVENVGRRTASLRLSVNDDRRYIRSFGQTKLVVPTTRSRSLEISVDIPEDAVPGTVVTVTFTGQASTAPLFYKQCEITVRPAVPLRCDSYNVVSDVSLRFATTTVTQALYNSDSTTQMADFTSLLPPGAYVTAFKATVGGVEHNGVIKEVGPPVKAPSTTEGEASDKERGDTRKFTVKSDSSSKKPSTKYFTTSVPVPSQSSVIFVLTYQQVIHKQRGGFRHEITLQAGETVTDDFNVVINICEIGAIPQITKYGLLSELDAIPTMQIPTGLRTSSTGNKAVITYEPTRGDQIKLSPQGVEGTIIVEYNVENTEPSNMVTMDSSFIHFLTPQLEQLTRRIVFVLDGSSYMYGNKMTIVRQAMSLMLNRLTQQDHYNIIAFNLHPREWKSVLVRGTEANQISSSIWLQNYSPSGSINLGNSILAGASMLVQHAADNGAELNPYTDYLFVIAGGEIEENIINDMRPYLPKNIGINTCGLGDIVDEKLMYNIAKTYNGESIFVSNTVNGAAMINEFSESLETTAMLNMQVQYETIQIADTSDLSFTKFASGGDAIVSGTFDTSSSNVEAVNFVLRGKTDKDNFDMRYSVIPVPADELCRKLEDEKSPLDRMRAFIIMMELIDNTYSNDDTIRIRDLAMLYGFVVPGLTEITLETANDSEMDFTAILEEPIERPTLPDETTTPSPTVSTTTTTVAPTLMTLPFADNFASPGVTDPPKPVDRNRTDNIRDKLKETKMEMYGDPHVVIDLTSQIRLCMNWDGESGEMFNLLNDPVTGISINARLASIKAPEGSVRDKRTYINKIGFVLSKHNTTVTINPYVARIRFGKKGSVVVRFSETKTFNGRGLRFVMEDINVYSGSFTIFIGKDIAFRVISKVQSSSSFIRDHLDYSVIRRAGISKAAKGILGEFNRVSSKQSATLDIQPDGQNAMLWYRNKVVPVTHHKIIDFNSNTEVECWYLANKSLLWKNEVKKFGVNDLLKSDKVRTPK